MVSLIGLETHFRISSSEFKEKSDALVCFIHWALIYEGFKATGKDEKKDDISEILPSGWNTTPKVYNLNYILNNERYLLKILTSDQLILCNFMRCHDEKIVLCNLDLNLTVGNDYQNFKTAFIDAESLYKTLKSDLINPFFVKPCDGKESYKDKNKNDEFCDNQSQVSHLRFIETQRCTDFPQVGQQDLDPFSSTSGGMLLDPHSLERIHVCDPQRTLPPNLIVPPGARFDHIGPPAPGIPLPRRGDPHYPGIFAAPNPDHLPPPGFDDMFG